MKVMVVNVSIQTIIWLFPIIFMLHEFEEIIFLPRWIRDNKYHILQKAPRIARKIIKRLETLSSETFAAMVFEEFLLLSVVTFLCVENCWYSLFAAVVVGYLTHVIVHLAQALFLRRYIPAVGTGLITGTYGLYSLYYLNVLGMLIWNEIIVFAPIVFAVIVLNLVFCHIIVKRLVNQE